MRGRTVGWIVGAVLVALLAVGAAGSVVMAAAWHGPMWWGRAGTASSTPGAYGPGHMMGGSGYGPGGMMGGTYGSSAQATPVTGVTLMTIQNFAFQPASIEVKSGTTVTWTNQDTAPHTVTFRNGAHGSGTLQQGQSFSYTFKTPGTYDYYCAVHPYMVARVTVTS